MAMLNSQRVFWDQKSLDEMMETLVQANKMVM